MGPPPPSPGHSQGCNNIETRFSSKTPLYIGPGRAQVSTFIHVFNVFVGYPLWQRPSGPFRGEKTFL